MTEQPEKPTSAPKEAPKSTIKENAPKEVGGPKGLEPTRYGDWEVNGRCSDF